MRWTAYVFWLSLKIVLAMGEISMRRFLVAGMAMTMALVSAAEAKRAPTCSSYKKRCYKACAGHQLEPQCQKRFCDVAHRKCMKTGIWNVRGYAHKKGMRRK